MFFSHIYNFKLVCVCVRSQEFLIQEGKSKQLF